MKIYYIPSKDKRVNLKLKYKLQILLTCAFINCSELQAKVKSVKDVESSVDSVGETIFKIATRMCYWVCVIACIYEILLKIKDGDGKAIIGVLTKYSLIYGGVFVVRVILDMIGGVFA